METLRSLRMIIYITYQLLKISTKLGLNNLDLDFRRLRIAFARKNPLKRPACFGKNGDLKVKGLHKSRKRHGKHVFLAKAIDSMIPYREPFTD